MKRLQQVVSQLPRSLTKAAVGEPPPNRLPLRLRNELAQEQQQAELLIGWVQGAVVLTWNALYALSLRTLSPSGLFQPVS
ncbi:hypothetical protein HUN39_15080 [Methylocystis sp. FS]|uniref:hypothetical protein n=1 Tax=Methylocystis silviterrae TaxID=2743612 RepID=UPI0015840D46|nr:hypothetical protein [Methylocystis silviterrae]NUJ81326.1 hypothetical protein [Methylocystis silviterrae]